MPSASWELTLPGSVLRASTSCISSAEQCSERGVIPSADGDGGAQKGEDRNWRSDPESTPSRPLCLPSLGWFKTQRRQIRWGPGCSRSSESGQLTLDSALCTKYFSLQLHERVWFFLLIPSICEVFSSITPALTAGRCPTTGL